MAPPSAEMGPGRQCAGPGRGALECAEHAPTGEPPRLIAKRSLAQRDIRPAETLATTTGRYLGQ